MVKTSYSGDGANWKKILSYEDQKIYEITDWKDQIAFSDPETNRTWNEYKYYIIKIEYGKEPYTNIVFLFIKQNMEVKNMKYVDLEVHGRF